MWALPANPFYFSIQGLAIGNALLKVLGQSLQPVPSTYRLSNGGLGAISFQNKLE